MKLVAKWLFLALAFAGLVPQAAAQSYPSKPLTLVVPYPPGGPNDVIARTLAPEMSEALGQPVVVENRPGAGGNIAAGMVARAAPDGYTVLLPGMSYAVNPSIFPKVPYTFADFTPIAVVAQGGLVLVAHPSLNVKSAKELIAAAKARPGQIPYASGGVGTSPHLAAALFALSAGIDLLHVPYKGTGDFMKDLLAGRTPVAFVSPLVIRPHLEAGRVVGLGVSSAKPLRGLEQVPAIGAQALPGYEMNGWYAMLVPDGTPKAVVEKLSGAVSKALASPSVEKRLSSLGLDLVKTTPAQAADYIQAEAERWEKVAKQAGIKME